MESHKNLIQRFFNGKSSSEELHKVYRLSKNKDFEAEVLDYIEREWEDFDEKIPSSTTDFEKIYKEIEIKRKKKKNQFFIQTMKVAASLVAIFIVSFLVYRTLYLDDNSLAYSEVITQRGETKQVILSDGTEVLINADSKLRYPRTISEDNHKIYIVGSAYFDLKEKSSGMEVFVDKIKADVSGGSFNVSAYPDEDNITIAVEEGGSMNTTIPFGNVTNTAYPVEYDEDGNPTNLSHPEAKDKVFVVKENEYISYNKTIFKTTLSQFDDHREYFAWVDGTMYFQNVNLSQMLKRLSRRFDVDFDLKGCTDKDKMYSGEFKNQTLKHILSHATSDMNIQYLEARKKVILTGECDNIK